MQVWIAGYHGFLREVFKLFFERSDDAELYSCVGQQIAFFRAEALN